MNKNLLMVIDHYLNPGKYTKEQLRQNASEAAAIYSSADAAADKDALAYASAAASVADVADYAADATPDVVNYYIDQYFEKTKESKQDYINEINKDKK